MNCYVVRGETDPVVHQGCSLQLVDKIEKSVAYRTFPGSNARRTRPLLLYASEERTFFAAE